MNLATNEIERVYHFDNEAAPERSYLNDVRLAHGFAFMSDSGLGAIVVLNITTGKVRRLLENHASTKAEPNVEPVVGGRPWKFADNRTPQVHSDGIAIDPKLEYLVSQGAHRSDALPHCYHRAVDESLSPEALGNLVERVAVTEPTDGLEFDTQGNLYMTAAKRMR